MKKGVLIFWGIIIVLIVLGVVSSFMVSSKPGKSDSLAQCIKSQGVVFYGAFWCPHCQRTKALFGSSEQYLPYVECSNPDGKSQTQICIDKKISTYPTWIRPDGATLTGEHTIEEWAAFSGCTLAGAATTPTPVVSTPTGSAAK
jgi:thiol-disulfide isomerase/thioredoxin